MGPLVSLEIRHPTIGLYTLRTGMWLSPSMDPLVFLEIRHFTEGHPTCTALVWLFPSMDPLVWLESRHVTKGLPTCAALVWLFPSMDLLVCLERRQLIKGLHTSRALMGLFSCVYYLMPCKNATCSKCFETLGAFMLFLPGVLSLMYFLIWSLSALGSFMTFFFVSIFLSIPSLVRLDPLNVAYNFIRKLNSTIYSLFSSIWYVNSTILIHIFYMFIIYWLFARM